VFPLDVLFVCSLHDLLYRIDCDLSRGLRNFFYIFFIALTPLLCNHCSHALLCIVC
jgi:hypothetical protein